MWSIKITSSGYNKGRRGNLFSLKENPNIITEGTGEGSFVIGLERRLFERNVSTTQKYWNVWGIPDQNERPCQYHIEEIAIR